MVYFIFLFGTILIKKEKMARRKKERKKEMTISVVCCSPG
jgi:hypothetical protein